MEKGEPRQFQTFCPLAYAGIGTMPFPTLSHRSVTLVMHRSDGRRPLRQFDLNDIGHLDTLYRKWCDLSQTTKLNPNPKMPPGLNNRAADNWRSLVAVADLFGPEWGDAARELAIKMSEHADADDRKLHVIWDTLDVFDHFGRPSIGSKALVEALCSLPDSPYLEWRGLDDNRPSHRMTVHDYADVVKDFGIRPRVVWPYGRRRPSSRGYQLEWFERLRKSYPRPSDEPSQASTDSENSALASA
jgi:hypothetical protein